VEPGYVVKGGKKVRQIHTVKGAEITQQQRAWRKGETWCNNNLELIIRGVGIRETG